MIKLLFLFMRSHRYPTTQTNSSRFSNNFQLLKPKSYDTKPNPQQIPPRLQSPRYDIDLKQKSNSYRVRKFGSKSSQKSEGGKTVYEIYNVRNRYQKSQYSQTSLASKSQGNYINYRSNMLQNQNKITEPQSFSVNNFQLNTPNQVSKNIKANYVQKGYQIRQINFKSEQQNYGSIVKQQLKKQSPLRPSRPIYMDAIMHRHEPDLCQIPEQQNQQVYMPTKNQGKSKFTPMSEQQLINMLNSRTRYYKYRHEQKLRATKKSQMNNLQNIYLSKSPSSSRIDHIQIKYGMTIEEIIKILHHENKSKLKLSIRIPQVFHECPDILLGQEELKFKATMVFEDLGIMKSGLICENQQIMIMKHPQSLMFKFYDKDINKTYGLNWYSDGSVYLGQIEADSREGKGLEWVPGEYVYYGQYQQNYRHGYGIIKYNNMEVYIGTWAYDHYHGYGKILDLQGSVKEQGTFRNSELKQSAFFNQLS